MNFYKFFESLQIVAGHTPVCTDKVFFHMIMLRPTLYILRVAERRNLKIGFPGRRESQLFLISSDRAIGHTCSVPLYVSLS